MAKVSGKRIFIALNLGQTLVLGLKNAMKKIAGGYEPIKLGELNKLLRSRKTKVLSATSVRVWLAAKEMKARRCKTKGERNYQVAELAELTSLSNRKIASSLRELKRARLLSFTTTELEFTPLQQDEISKRSENRLVPFPRRLLRVLAKHQKPAELVAILAHLSRLLWLKKHEVSGVGFVSASWLTETYGISRRSVMNARRWLVNTGVLAIRKVSQILLNRHGQCFEVCLERRNPDTAPPRVKNCAASAPLIKNQELLRSTRNQEPTSGLQVREACLTNVTPEDLRSLSRLRSLYRQAVAREWIGDSESEYLNFVAASVRAVQARGDSVRIFVAIVRKRLWAHITQAEEDQARCAIKKTLKPNLKLSELGIQVCI